MMQRLRSSAAHLLAVLAGHSMPVWLSLVLVMGGAVATYYIAPLINAQFEIQVARREFLVANLTQFSVDTKELIESVGELINENDQNKREKILQNVNISLTKLQFSSAQIARIIPKESGLIVAFQRHLLKLQESLSIQDRNKQNLEIKDSVKNIVPQSIIIYDLMLDRAGLSRL
ncbi:hypothetical protein [Ancylobacter radicis]|uniref:Uncharacterized protein n=1 Tax=Ancylobacter radicis TaxID=2836179 RepID=A0ABS5R341_9HYPH|nr:hypothetical protein [Ancylobacter radicis]MBS9476080.1 hypothetical protein [Ancylobacter radicis]